MASSLVSASLTVCVLFLSIGATMSFGNRGRKFAHVLGKRGEEIYMDDFPNMQDSALIQLQRLVDSEAYPAAADKRERTLFNGVWNEPEVSSKELPFGDIEAEDELYRTMEDVPEVTRRTRIKLLNLLRRNILSDDDDTLSSYINDTH